MIQIPPGSNDDLMNWLTSGETSRDGKSRSQNPNKAMSEKEPKYVYNRAAATSLMVPSPPMAMIL